MANIANKERVGLNATELGKFMREVAKSVTESEQWGKTVWFDLVTWDDGSKSLGGYNGETKQRYKLGTVMPSKDQPQQKAEQPFETVSKTQEVADDLPF
jgi:hypothetical protein